MSLLSPNETEARVYAVKFFLSQIDTDQQALEAYGKLTDTDQDADWDAIEDVTPWEPFENYEPSVLMEHITDLEHDVLGFLNRCAVCTEKVMPQAGN